MPFLEPAQARRLLDDRGNFMLYRQILPLDSPNLYFKLPAPDALQRDVAGQLAFMDEAVDGHHCHGTKIIPFSMHNVDEILGDLDLNIPVGTRAAHWLNPISPRAYREVTPRLLDRLAGR